MVNIHGTAALCACSSLGHVQHHEKDPLSFFMLFSSAVVLPMHLIKDRLQKSISEHDDLLVMIAYMKYFEAICLYYKGVRSKVKITITILLCLLDNNGIILKHDD